MYKPTLHDGTEIHFLKKKRYRKQLQAIKAAGLFPDGRPLKLFKNDAPVSEKQIVNCLSACFGKYKDEMVEQQLLWMEALKRPNMSEARIKMNLKRALKREDYIIMVKHSRAMWQKHDTICHVARDCWMGGDRIDARKGWFVWDALTFYYGCIAGWINDDKNLLNYGVREAYRWGAKDLVFNGDDLEQAG